MVSLVLLAALAQFNLQGHPVKVATPKDYGAKPAHELFVVFDGDQYAGLGLPELLPDAVVVLVDNGRGGERLSQLANVDSYQRWVAGELMPWVRKQWKVTRDPHHTTLMGSSAGGLAAAFVAFRHPDLFGNVISQSGAFWRGPEGSNGAPWEWLTAQIAASPKVDVKFVLDAGALETQHPMGGAAPTMVETSTHLAKVLREKGNDVTLTIVPGGQHSPASWEKRLPELVKQR